MLKHFECFKDIHYDIISKHKSVKKKYTVPFYRIHREVNYALLFTEYSDFSKNYKNYLKI